jgi:predicted MFS family arabinose efflux permease
VLTDLLSWRWAFFINIPVAVFVLLVARTVLAEGRQEQRPKVDLPGAITVTLGLLAIIYGVTTAGVRSWGDPRVLTALVVGAVLLVVFWVIEKRVAAPLVPVAILRRPNVGWGNAAGLLAFVTETSLVFLLTLYLQKVLGYSPLEAGLSFAVLGVGTVLGGVVGPKVIGRINNNRAIVVGFTVQAVATCSLVLLGPAPAWIALLLVATFVGGVANLVAIVGFMVTATSGLPNDEQGLATGLTTMSQQVGITMGIPIMSAIATARVHALGGENPHTVLSGVTTAIFVNTALCVVTAILIGVFLRPAGRSAA